MGRKLGRIAVYTALVFGLLGFCVYLARNPVRDLLGRTASGWVSRGLNGTLEVGALRGSLFSSLVLRNVVLRDRQGVEIAHLDEVRLEYDLKKLLTKRLVIHRINIVHPQVKLVQESEGTWNLNRVLLPSPTPAPAAGGGPPVAIVVEDVQLHDGEVALATAALPGVQHLAGIQAHLQGQVDGDGFRVQVHSLSARATPAEVVLHSVQGALEGNAAAIQLTALRLQTAQTLVTADGILPGGTQPASLELHMQPFDVTELGRMLQRDDVYGPLYLTLTAQGPSEALAVRGQLSTEGGRLDLEGQLNTSATPWRYSSRLALVHVNLATLLHQEPLQSDLNLQVHLEGEGVTPAALRGTVRLDIQASHVGSIALYPSHLHLAMQHGHFEVQQCNLQTSVGHLTATGLLDLAGSSTLDYDLTADLGGLRSLMRTEALEGSLHLQGQASGALTAMRAQGTLTGQRLRYENYHVGTLQVTYEGSELGTQPHLMARLEIQKIDVGSVPVEHLTLDATYAGTERQLQVSTAVQSSLYSGKVRGSLHWTDAGQQLTLDELFVRLKDHPWQLVAPVEVVRDAQGLRLTPLHLAHADEALELAGAFDGVHFQDVQLRATQIDLSFLQRLLPLPDFIQGHATLQAHLTGTLAAPVFDMDLLLRSEPRQQAPRDQVQVTLTYAQQQLQGEIRVRQANREVLTVDAGLPIDLALTPMQLEQRFLESPVVLHVHLQQLNLATFSRWQPTLPGLTGTLQGDIHVQGIYTALELDTDVRLQQVGLKGSVEQVSAPIRLQATFGLLTPDTGTAQAESRRFMLPSLQKVVLRVPTLRGQLLGQGQPPRTLQAQDLLLQATGKWESEGLDLTLERLQVQLRLPGWPHAEVFMAGRLTPQRLELARLQVRLPRSEARGSGSLTLPQQQVQLHLDIPRLQLDEVGFVPPAPLPQLVQGVIEVRGSVPAPQIEVRLQYAGGQLYTDLTAQLQEPVPRYSGTLRLDDLNMAQVLTGVQGTLRARLQVQGTGFTELQRRAQAELSIETTGLTLVPGLTTHVKVNLRGNTLQLEDMQVRSTPLTVMARGTLSTSEKTSLTYEVTLGDLAPLQRYVGVPLQAKGSLKGTVQGTWPALQARSQLQLREWGYRELHGQRVQADLTVSQFPTAPQATMKAQVIDVQGPTLPSSAATLTATYTPSQGTVQMNVTAGPYQKTGLEGRVTLAQEQRLTLTRFRLQQQDVAWENADPITAVRSSQGRLDLQRFVLRNGRQEVSARGILMPDGGLEAEVQVQHLRILPSMRMVAPHMSEVDGEVMLHLRLHGTLAQPRGEGELHITSLRWQQYQLGEVHSQVQANSTAVNVDLRWLDQKQELLRLSGNVGLDTRQALALQLQANTDLQVLKSFSSAVVQSAGTLSLDLRLAGTLQQPQVDGTLRLDDGALQLAATGVRYQDIQVQLSCAGNRVELIQLHAQSGGGTLDLTGWVESAGLTLQRLNLDLQMQQFTLMHTPDLEAVVSTAVTVRGSLDEMVATGTVTIPRARAQLNGKLVGRPDAVQPWQLTVEGVYGSGPQKATAEQATSGASPTASLAFLKANLQLQLPRNVWVNGSGTAIELSGDLTITKELRGPFVLSGTVETVRGFASYYNQKFVLEQGRVTFTGSPEINPVLDVTVTRAVSSYVVSINVSGRAMSPQLRLSSIPDLPQADIVTLLVLGKTTDNLTASERGGLSSGAQQIIGGVATSELEQLLAKPLGLDTVEVQTGDKLGSGRVNVGRYITQDIFLSYERQVGKPSENSVGQTSGNKVGVEYSINRHLKLKGSSSDTGVSAFDILWRIDY